MATRTKIKLDPLRIDGHEVGRVLITGASAGIGAELAREFARNGHQLTLVARRRAKLAAVAAELERDHYVDVRTIVQDLAKPTTSARFPSASITGRISSCSVVHATAPRTTGCTHQMCSG